MEGPSSSQMVQSRNVICIVPATGVVNVLHFDVCVWEKTVKRSGSALCRDESVCCQANQEVLT